MRSAEGSSERSVWVLCRSSWNGTQTPHSVSTARCKMRGSPHYSHADRSTLYIRVMRVCRTRSGSRLSRPGAGYPRSEGSGAKFEIYLAIATIV